MIHRRKISIRYVDEIKYYKTITVDVGLDRMKEWELTIKDFGIKVNDNKISYAEKQIKDCLRQLHKDYLENNLEEELKTIYSEYIKPYFGRSQNTQIENIRRMREEHNRLKENEDKNNQ